MDKKWKKRRKRLLEIIEVGSDWDLPSRIYDYINAGAIVVNVFVSILYTFAEVRAQIGFWLLLVEEITIAFFALDYIFHVLTAGELYDELTETHAVRKYVFSVSGLIDLLSFLPYYLPVFFPSGTAVFRMVRIVRIFRLFRINAYHDSLSVIIAVISGKKQQLISSVFIIVILMLASSLSMYSLEHEAQPEVFTNAFSGIWWAASTLLTVGYGDIYPITTAGKMLGIIITFLGVGMVAIPTGIISAGFVDQYSNIKKRTEYGYEADMHFIKIRVRENDKWLGMRIADLDLPAGVIIAIIKRKEEIIIPRGDVVLQEGDSMVLGAEPFEEHEHINLKEIVLRDQNPWTGARIRDLDISRHSVIVLVKRRNKALIPNGNMVLLEGDRVFLYTRQHLLDVNEIEI
ncbi:MAG: ion transporter [Roseburia sp.]|nr:ion transporter [Roseburia sp.]